ncbi:hypothetical protein NDU88_003238 [Pleurodeles waltl]|uniref:Nuclease HARBI1 n=1 Tax=Pleurodeles waltl TaxID=8319 RepID=A0AAV7T561_PLEWA|nr:hypothetical protein NDU88_003238 [Pleurodeles waltl]
MVVTYAAVRTATAGAHRHWLLRPIGHRPLGHVRRWRHPPVYRPLVDLSTMEERHLILTYRLDRATILELCAQLEPDLMSPIRHPTGIPPQEGVRADLRPPEDQVQVLHMTDGSLFYSPKKVCQIIVACCMLHNLALRRQVPFLQEDGSDGGVVAAVEPVESEEEEDEEDDIDNRNTVILQYFQ